MLEAFDDLFFVWEAEFALTIFFTMSMRDIQKTFRVTVIMQ